VAVVNVCILVNEFKLVGSVSEIMVMLSVIG